MDLDFLVAPFQDTVTPLLRTDFSDNQAWERVVAAVRQPLPVGDPDPAVPGDDGTYTASIEVFDDRALEGVSVEALVEGWRPNRELATGYVVVADSRSMAEAAAGDEITVVYVDLYAEDEDAELGWIYGNSFRCLAREVASIEANLAISNLDFSDFANDAGEDGVYRG